jgi:hypothetical protein
MDYTAYAGYLLRGVPGALAASSGFILPTCIIVVAYPRSTSPTTTTTVSANPAATAASRSRRPSS